MPPPEPVPDTRSPTATIDDRTAAAHTVAELAQFWRQTRSLPGKSAKHLSDIILACFS